MSTPTADPVQDSVEIQTDETPSESTEKPAETLQQAAADITARNAIRQGSVAPELSPVTPQTPVGGEAPYVFPFGPVFTLLVIAIVIVGFAALWKHTSTRYVSVAENTGSTAYDLQAMQLPNGATTDAQGSTLGISANGVFAQSITQNQLQQASQLGGYVLPYQPSYTNG